MNKQALQAILDNAPDGATHVDDIDSCYWLLSVGDYSYTWINGVKTTVASFVGDYSFRSLSDIKTIVGLMEEKDSKAITMLYGMGGFLTSMDESITFSAKHWASPAVDIVSAIIDSNNLEGKCNFDSYVSPKVVFTQSVG